MMVIRQVSYWLLLATVSPRCSDRPLVMTLILPIRTEEPALLAGRSVSEPAARILGLRERADLRIAPASAAESPLVSGTAFRLPCG